MVSIEAASSPAPPKGATLEEELAFYKEQYQHLETELQDFQASSKELEAELERDVEASEQRERQLKEKVENLGFEVDEWKVCKKYPSDRLIARLTVRLGKTPTGEDRGKRRTKCVAEGGYDIAR